MKKKEMIETLEQARQNKLAYIEACQGNINPQVIELRNKAQGEAAAFEAVLLAMKGQSYMLKVYARGHIMV